MDSSYFVQSKNSFSIDGLKCVRNDYFYNSCEECINICPTSAITLFRNKLTLKDSLCTECSICIGVCPSEAINSSIFSENDFIINTKESKLSCQSSTPCLSIFDEHHFVSLAIVKESDIEVDLSYCGDCNFNDNQSVESSIRDRVNSSNNFLEKIGVTQRVTIKDTKDEKSRRDIFKGLHSFTKKVIDSSKKISSSDFKNEFEKRVPTKKIILKNALKTILDKINTKVEDIECLHSQKIDYEKCTNCQECIEFCPTDALFANQVQDTIYIQTGKCIGCEICHNICKEKAIESNNQIDLVEFAFDKAKALVEFEIRSCTECKLSFPYKGKEEVCNRCQNFTDEFTDMFTMAKDIK